MAAPATFLAKQKAFHATYTEGETLSVVALPNLFSRYAVANTRLQESTERDSTFTELSYALRDNTCMRRLCLEKPKCGSVLRLRDHVARLVVGSKERRVPLCVLQGYSKSAKHPEQASTRRHHSMQARHVLSLPGLRSKRRVSKVHTLRFLRERVGCKRGAVL